MREPKLSPRTSTASIPYPTTEERTCRDGNVVLFHRKHSAQWQARIRRYSGKWYDVSTGSEDFGRAKEVAGRKYDKMLAHQEAGTQDVTKAFKDVARLTIKALQNETQAGIGKVIYRDYIQAINNYLIPCFGSTAIHNVDARALAKLATFRREKLRREPNRSTVGTHNAALGRVFTTAVEKGFMLATQVPVLTNNGMKPQARPYFAKDEFETLVGYLEKFASTGHKGETQLVRELLLDYVLILANTGMRTGREALGLKWNNIRRLSDGATLSGLEFSVNGKTGKRALIAQDADGTVTTSLRRIHARLKDISQLTDDELYKQDIHVFRLRNLKRPAHGRLGVNFKIALAQSGLLKNAQGEERTLYSLRHMYATFQILNGVDMATLAVQMGTSIGMLERHYSKLKPYMKLATLNGTRAYSDASIVERLERLVAEQSVMIQRLLQRESQG
jgi:integrase